MSDTEIIEPMSDSEMGQIDAGISQNFRQPINAPRYLRVLLRRFNFALSRIKQLEKEVESLKAKETKAPNDQKPKAPAQPSPATAATSDI